MKSAEATREAEETRSTRDDIMDAAERLFAEHGFAGVSMRDIVAETSLKNQASLYHHFRNKRHLYEAVLARGLQNIVGLTPPRATGTVGELNANLDRLLDYLSQHPHLAQLIQRAALDDAGYLETAVGILLRPLSTQGRRALEGAGQIWSADELPHLAAGLYNLIFGYFANAPILRAVVNDDPLSPAAVQRQRQFLKNAVARLLGIGPHRGEGGATRAENR